MKTKSLTRSRRAMNRSVLATLVAACAVLFAARVQAQTVTFVFEAEVTFFNGTPFGITGVNVGDPATGSFSYDTSTPDDDPTSGLGIYSLTTTDGFLLVVNGHTYSSSDYTITVHDNLTNVKGTFDLFSVQANTFNVDGSGSFSSPDDLYRFLLIDDTATALSSESLPLTLEAADYISSVQDIFTQTAFGVGGQLVLTLTRLFSPAVSAALVDAGIDPSTVPPEVLDALIAADEQDVLTVIPPNTTDPQNVILEPNEVVVLGDGSTVNGNIEGGPDNTVVMGGNSALEGNIVGVGISFMGGSNVVINGNVSGEVLVGPGAEVDFNQNVEAATFVLEEGAVVTIGGNLEVAVNLELGLGASLFVSGNIIICDPLATVSIDCPATITFGGSDACLALPPPCP